MGITSSQSCFPNSGCETLEQKFIFQIGTLSCYSPPPSQHHNCLRNEPLYFKIIQLNIIVKKKKVTAIFSQFRLGLELDTKQDTPPIKKSSYAIYFSLLNFSLPFPCKFSWIITNKSQLIKHSYIQFLLLSSKLSSIKQVI